MNPPTKKRRVAFEDDNAASTTKDVTTKPSKGKRKVKGKGKEKEKATIQPTAISQPSKVSFKVIAGSYEKILYGLEGTIDPSSSEIALKPIFIFPAHLSCIKSLASSPSGGRWLVTGSGDEIIKVWDLRRHKEVGGLVQHEGKCLLSLCGAG